MQLNFFNKNYQLQLASNQLPVTSRRLPTASNYLSNFLMKLVNFYPNVSHFPCIISKRSLFFKEPVSQSSSKWSIVSSFEPKE